MTTKRPHIPVLAEEIIQAFLPVIKTPAFDSHEKNTCRIFDGTLGRGGHLRLLMDEAKKEFPHINFSFVGYDRDKEAIDYIKENFSEWFQDGKLRVEQKNFMLDFSSQIEGTFDFALLDLGVSSPQLDQKNRGFSFYENGPLDMRMDQSACDPFEVQSDDQSEDHSEDRYRDHSEQVTAKSILAEYSEQELIELFKTYGEIPSPYRVVRAIVHDRKTNPFTETLQLAGLIERVDGWRRKGHHPATNYFLALRLKVNGEIDNLENGLKQVFDSLNPGGRLAVITFHSLEDRIVKYSFKEENQGRLVNKKVITPTQVEMEANPRSRSAKLRIIEKK